MNLPEVADIGAGVLLTAERVALVWVDSSTASQGHVRCRITDSDGRCIEQAVALHHGCLSCAMCEAVGGAVRDLIAAERYDVALIHLDPGVEADGAIGALSTELAGLAVIDTVVLHLHHTWLADLAGATTMADCGLAVAPDDDRSLATVLAADIDAATVIVMPGGPTAASTAEEHAALAVLAPRATRLHPVTPIDISHDLLLHTRTFHHDQLDLFTPRGLLDRHFAPPDESGSLRLTHWSAERPLHPQRLYDRLDRLGEGVICSVGYLWVSTRPNRVVRWRSAGDCLSIGPGGLWTTRLPAGPDHPIQTQPSPAQHRHADRHRHPDYRDRHTLLGFLGIDLDPNSIRADLDACLLTDDELAAGPHQWTRLADPFPTWSDGSPATDRGQGAA
jgi:G3E family GTPase